MRWNTLLHRYELTARLWNLSTQDFVPENYETPAVYVGGLPDEANYPSLKQGQVLNDIAFSIRIDDGSAKSVVIHSASTALIANSPTLTRQLNLALSSEGLGGKVTALERGGRLLLQTLSVGATAKIEITAANDNAVASGISITAAALFGANNGLDFQRHFAFYTVVDTEQTVIETREGNDEVRADPEFLIRGSEWGFDQKIDRREQTLI